MKTLPIPFYVVIDDDYVVLQSGDNHSWIISSIKFQNDSKECGFFLTNKSRNGFITSLGTTLKSPQNTNRNSSSFYAISYIASLS